MIEIKKVYESDKIAPSATRCAVSSHEDPRRRIHRTTLEICLALTNASRLGRDNGECQASGRGYATPWEARNSLSLSFSLCTLFSSNNPCLSPASDTGVYFIGLEMRWRFTNWFRYDKSTPLRLPREIRSTIVNSIDRGIYRTWCFVLDIISRLRVVVRCVISYENCEKV